jgi:hypothetical protein
MGHKIYTVIKKYIFKFNQLEIISYEVKVISLIFLILLCVGKKKKKANPKNTENLVASSLRIKAPFANYLAW